MTECDNSTRKIHISSNFILSISLQIMFDTLLLRPSLRCNTTLHFTTLHFTSFRYTSPHFTQLHFTSRTLFHPVKDLYFSSFSEKKNCSVYCEKLPTVYICLTWGTSNFQILSLHLPYADLNSPCFVFPTQTTTRNQGLREKLIDA
jgi:hypothetical protein